MDEAYHQYDEGYSVRMCHTISTEETYQYRVSVEGVQHGPVTSSVRRRVCSTGLPDHSQITYSVDMTRLLRK